MSEGCLQATIPCLFVAIELRADDRGRVQGGDPGRGRAELVVGIADGYITTSDTTNPFIEMHGPIRRSWAQQLNHQEKSFLFSSANDLENKLLPNNLIVIRNQGVDHEGHVGHQVVSREPRRHTHQGGDPIPPCLQIRGILESDFESKPESKTTLPSN
jgi:hypothetical protein